MKRKLFSKKTHYLIAGFIVALAVMLVCCESASAGNVYVEEQHDSTGGSTDFNGGYDRLCIGGELDTGAGGYICPVAAVAGYVDWGSAEIGFTETISERWRIGLRLAQYDDEMFGGATIRRLVGDGPFKLTLGASYWIDESPGSNAHVTFNIGLRWVF